jgi:acetoin utilization deacetylase AcuC-like enzyme
VIPVVWSDDCLLHEPGGEVWVGVRTPGTEVPDRALRIRAELGAAVAAVAHPDASVTAVHDAGLVGYLRGAWDAWAAADLPSDRVVPYLFPSPDLFSGFSPAVPVAPSARAGRWCYDTMTLIGPGTWPAARAAADVALTAVDLVASGERAAYALTRPPGHHATRAAFGGSCYLNNAAIAAAALRRVVGDPVAVVDIDAHHGNGTQAIFWDDAGVLTGSVHVDPAAGWFPHFLGFESESHASNRNVCLAPGSGDSAWLAALESLLDWAGSARGLVVALGVDAAAGDPEAPLRGTPDGFTEAGRLLAAAGVPTVIVQEGGYDLDTIGPLVSATLASF